MKQLSDALMLGFRQAFRDLGSIIHAPARLALWFKRRLHSKGTF